MNRRAGFSPRGTLVPPRTGEAEASRGLKPALQGGNHGVLA